jgi:thioredoxin reductase
MKFVIIGAGPAGVRAAETLRENDPQATITLVGDEPGEPYARMAIPYILSGAIDDGGARQRRSLGHLQALGIRYLHGKALKVQARPEWWTGRSRRRHTTPLRPPAGRDRFIALAATPPRHRLARRGDVLDAGGRPPDRRQARPRRARGHAGRGFRRGRVHEVTGQQRSQAVCRGRALGPDPAFDDDPGRQRMLQRWLEGRGVEVITTGRVLGIEAGPRLVMDSRSIDADLIILATGVHPNVAFLEGTGAEIRSGVVIDAHMRTTVPQIYAAGDVAQGRDFSTGEWVVHALQPTATEHGRVAALNMLGKDVPYRGSLSMNVLDTVGLISHTFGLWNGIPGGDHTEVVDEANFIYTRLCFDGDQLIGAITIGHPHHVGAIRGLIQSHRHLGAWKDELMKNPHLVMDAFVDLNNG